MHKSHLYGAHTCTRDTYTHEIIIIIVIIPVVCMVSFSFQHAISIVVRFCPTPNSELCAHCRPEAAYTILTSARMQMWSYVCVCMCAVVLRLGDNRTNNRTQCCSMGKMFVAAPKSL